MFNFHTGNIFPLVLTYIEPDLTASFCVLLRPQAMILAMIPVFSDLRLTRPLLACRLKPEVEFN